MLRDGPAEKPFLSESQNEAAHVMGGQVGDTPGPNGTHSYCPAGALSGERGRLGREGATTVITLTATSRSTLSGLNQPQRLKHFSLLGEKLGQRLPISDGQFYLFKEEVYYSQFLKNMFWHLFCIPWVISTAISFLYRFYCYYILLPCH